jgi:hypothetical protein
MDLSAGTRIMTKQTSEHVATRWFVLRLTTITKFGAIQTHPSEVGKSPSGTG